MEASTLQKKKNTISKGKLKKNIKNVLCRPDQMFWPEATEEQGKRLELAMNKCRIKIPEFKKPHWKELKLIPKESRPKPPKLKKVDGLLLGISECSDAINKGQCTAILIEATVNPRMIVQPILEMCAAKEIPVICIKDLRKLSLTHFGVKTSCLGITNGLAELKNEILDISKQHLRPKSILPVQKVEKEENKVESKEVELDTSLMDTSELPYLYRTNKKSRVFIPTAQENLHKPTKKFIGQDFIEFPGKVDDQKNSNAYMKMILKRISNNPDRVKKK